MDLDQPTDSSAVEAVWLSAISNVGVVDTQLHMVPMQLTEMEGHDFVVRCGRCGLEAWRLLHRRFDPATGGRKRNIFSAIISPGRCRLDELQTGLAKWEILVHRYQRKTRHPLDDELNLAGLEALCPQELEDHLLVNAGRLSTSDLARCEILTCVEAKTGLRIKHLRPADAARGGARANPAQDAMDVDALQRCFQGN